MPLRPAALALAVLTWILATSAAAAAVARAELHLSATFSTTLDDLLWLDSSEPCFKPKTCILRKEESGTGIAMAEQTPVADDFPESGLGGYGFEFVGSAVAEASGPDGGRATAVLEGLRAEVTFFNLTASPTVIDYEYEGDHELFRDPQTGVARAFGAVGYIELQNAGDPLRYTRLMSVGRGKPEARGGGKFSIAAFSSRSVVFDASHLYAFAREPSTNTPMVPLPGAAGLLCLGLGLLACGRAAARSR